ncbi:hypothetical protein [Blastococcus deserti]|uniref:Uncharacterized protein n=1 Tax=Blastococcus deserti TaxID=2259033 RepID=A0ABW4XF37_9ACTN
MTETGRPYGGVNDPGQDEGLPGERPEKGQVTADDDQSPRAAQGGMSGDVTHVPDGGADSKAAGGPDPTGPTG